jgi:hypothetical protein
MVMVIGANLWMKQNGLQDLKGQEGCFAMSAPLSGTCLKESKKDTQDCVWKDSVMEI